MNDYGKLTILTKLHDMAKYAYPALAQFPKSEKFAIVVDIKRCMNAVLEKAIEASKQAVPQKDDFAGNGCGT